MKGILNLKKKTPEEEEERKRKEEEEAAKEEERRRQAELAQREREEEEARRREEEQQKIKELQDRIKAEKERAEKEKEDAARAAEEEAMQKRLEELRKKEEARKLAEAKMREKESFLTREAIKKLEFIATKRELTEEEKRKITEYYETRKLMTYHWWHRLNRPMKKEFQKRCKKGSMVDIDLEVEDLELLPWIMGGMYVDVPLVSNWLANLSEEVIHTSANWM